MPPKQRRIAIMGYRSVGKSSLTIQFVENHFVDSYDPTIENTFQKMITVRGQEFQLQLVDTAGQDEYSLPPQSYYVNIDGYVLVYSTNSKKSFDVIKFVYDRILDMKGTDMKGPNTVPVVLVGNKSDLRIEREVSYDKGKELANSWDAPFLESSAKENQRVEEIFKCIITRIEACENKGHVQEKSGCLLS